MNLMLEIIFFILGLIVGSFLNVVIYRINTARGLGGRSACMACRTKLAWYELIPLFSYLGLQGRCKTCQTKISLQYPLVELASGLIFLIVFLKIGNLFFANPLVFAISYLYYVAMFSILLVIVVYDIKHKIIPDQLSLLFGILAFAGLFFSPAYFAAFSAFTTPNLIQFLSGPLIALPFFVLWLFSRGAWMGLGDAKLALGLGWFLGLALALSALALSFWIGAAVGIAMVFIKGYRMKTEIPFAPYLALGTLIVFIFELNLFNFYF